jgi:hypothetical protein
MKTEEDLVCRTGEPVVATIVIQETRMINQELWLQPTACRLSEETRAYTLTMRR